MALLFRSTALPRSSHKKEAAISGTRDELEKRLNEALTLPKPFDAETLLAIVDFVATRLEVAAALRASAQANPGPGA